MKHSLYPGLAGLYIWRICGIAKVLLVHFPLGETVSPNSPVRFLPLPCSFNKYLNTDKNGTSKCSRCSICPKGFQMQTECSLYNDTICDQCLSGWYNDVRGSRCKPCSSCEIGEYIRRSCTVKRDTSCRHCPRQTFSVDVNVTRCQQCRRCNQNEKIVSKCKSNKDTVCGDCENGYFRVSSTGSCLPCSHCPAVLQHRVVPECRDQRGIHHPDICWPSNIRYRFPDSGFSSSSVDDITNGNIKSKQEESSSDIPVYFFVTIFGSIICCSVIIMIGFICLRLLPSWRYLSVTHTVAVEEPQTSIPMLPVFASTRNSYDSSHGSLTAGNYDTESDCGVSKTKTCFHFEDSNVCCNHRDTLEETSLELGEKSICKFGADRQCDIDARADSVQIFTTTNLMTSCERSLQEKSGTSFGESSDSLNNKPLSSSHNIYRTV